MTWISGNVRFVPEGDIAPFGSNDSMTSIALANRLAACRPNC
jgi:hypothetical protein